MEVSMFPDRFTFVPNRSEDYREAGPVHKVLAACAVVVIAGTYGIRGRDAVRAPAPSMSGAVARRDEMLDPAR